MGINYHPDLGEALWCDYSGMAPEMIKTRIAIVIVPRACQRARLTTVVPLSTTPPQIVRPWHVRLDRDPLPGGGAGDVWAKCDMINVVSFDRLRGYFRRWRGRREYYKMKVSLKELEAIRQGVLNALGHPWQEHL
ncbi:type II toxin-antitoxin system PemK/MazF family toxin [Lysobacter sp. KIS68-7]|uniref:type II toxin-antitoxin system PemK/MazF family toxin n=1 Tax=Lysobacter sp. KIS68-7 TaxID=2904252 RepID=UPI001E59A30B|nr:type II toxin-antitoxin system PemK/MazF family toxin [Lysobacter sp. KIS68-7]UHQ18273.1 type II toxin-antitoxin system PemK/MazF family toxin [Lysobacter sp. KIS68-7]